jgi:hypothetical protein
MDGAQCVVKLRSSVHRGWMSHTSRSSSKGNVRLPTGAVYDHRRDLLGQPPRRKSPPWRQFRAAGLGIATQVARPMALRFGLGFHPAAKIGVNVSGT